MSKLRVSTQVVAVVYGLLAALLAMVGSFADGDDAGARFLITLLHPTSAVGLLAAAFVVPVRKPLIIVAGALLFATALGDLYVAGRIAAGAIQGDWEIPALLAALPAGGFLLSLALLKAPVPASPDD